MSRNYTYREQKPSNTARAPYDQDGTPCVTIETPPVILTQLGLPEEECRKVMRWLAATDRVSDTALEQSGVVRTSLLVICDQVSVSLGNALYQLSQRLGLAVEQRDLSTASGYANQHNVLLIENGALCFPER